MASLILPQFIAGNSGDKYRALSQLMTDNAVRFAIEVQLKQLLSSGRIGLETNHLNKNIQFEEWELVGLTRVPSRRQRVYYTPQLGEVLATGHQWGRRKLLLRFPLLPCLKIRGGLIKKWKEVGVSKPHIFYYPMELITVVETKQNTFHDHASRWCPRETSHSQDEEKEIPVMEEVFVNNLQPITPTTTPPPYEFDQPVTQASELPSPLEDEWEKNDGGWGNEEISPQLGKRQEIEKTKDGHLSNRFPPPNANRKASAQQQQDMEKFNPCRIKADTAKQAQARQQRRASTDKQEPNPFVSPGGFGVGQQIKIQEEETVNSQAQVLELAAKNVLERMGRKDTQQPEPFSGPGFGVPPIKILRREDKHPTTEVQEEIKGEIVQQNKQEEQSNPKPAIGCKIHTHSVRPHSPSNEPSTSSNTVNKLLDEKRDRIQNLLELTIKLLQDLTIA